MSYLSKSTIYPNNTPTETPREEILTPPPISFMSYEEYMKDLESMCQKDKAFMNMLRKYCEEKEEEDEGEEKHSSQSDDSWRLHA